MTTIAINNDIVAVDSQITAGNYVKSRNAEKFVRRADHLFLWTGRVTIHDQLESGVLPEDIELRSDEAIIQISSVTLNDNTITVVYEWYHDDRIHKTVKQQITQFPYAIGTGSDVALGAMMYGASPSSALRVAASVDIFTGGAIHKFKISDPGYHEVESEF